MKEPGSQIKESREAADLRPPLERPLSLSRNFRHLFLQRLRGFFAPDKLLRERYATFRRILQLDRQAVEMISDLADHLNGGNPADQARIRRLSIELADIVGIMTDLLRSMRPLAYRALPARFRKARDEIRELTAHVPLAAHPPYTIPLDRAADFPELAGGKATQLSAAGRAGVSIPSGFVITANAFRLFSKANNLEQPLLDRLRQVQTADYAAIVRITAELQELILAADVPEQLIEEMERGIASLQPVDLLAVRSSALAEDGRISFAGQYASELDVPPDDIAAAYKRVVAGKYCPRAITYRIAHGLSDDDTTMAVLVVPMYRPRAAGVLYTRDPSANPDERSLCVYAVPGLAAALVDGTRTPEFHRLPPLPLPLGEPADPGARQPLLNAEELRLLRSWGLHLEQHFGCPQDIEWVCDEQGITVLQSRPLQQTETMQAPVIAVDVSGRLLYSGLQSAAAGISCGPVFRAATGKDFPSIPPGAVVLTPALRPALSQFLDRIAAVVADHGSRACHFATVARERGVPVVIGPGIELAQGQTVTVDALGGNIYDGCIDASLSTGEPQRPGKPFLKEKYLPLAARTVQLNLLDPDAPEFQPAGCRSLHDMVRFCHERSVREMFRLNSRYSRGLGKARKLTTDLPFTLYVLDLDGQMRNRGKSITADQIASLPMQACWRGLSTPKIDWGNDRQNLDWEHFDRVSGGIVSLESRSLASYALFSREYLHLGIRFGYHFSLIDAFCCEDSESNYISFRFMGGGASFEQQTWRLDFIEHVVTSWGFDVSRRDDKLEATLPRAALIATEQALSRLGMLLAATRRMDIRLFSGEQARQEAENFLKLVES